MKPWKYNLKDVLISCSILQDSKFMGIMVLLLKGAFLK